MYKPIRIVLGVPGGPLDPVLFQHYSQQLWSSLIFWTRCACQSIGRGSDTGLALSADVKGNIKRRNFWCANCRTRCMHILQGKRYPKMVLKFWAFLSNDGSLADCDVAILSTTDKLSYQASADIIASFIHPSNWWAWCQERDYLGNIKCCFCWHPYRA